MMIRTPYRYHFDGFVGVWIKRNLFRFPLNLIYLESSWKQINAETVRKYIKVIFSRVNGLIKLTAFQEPIYTSLG